ncbi:hypothetical protein A9P82_05735 [Arachidicoccus ginsenosidimutans]|nr:hypothetical protein A9P82_05735 [Arachidicoccus sp. BS20]
MQSYTFISNFLNLHLLIIYVACGHAPRRKSLLPQSKGSQDFKISSLYIRRVHLSSKKPNSNKFRFLL